MRILRALWIGIGMAAGAAVDGDDCSDNESDKVAGRG